MSSDIEDFRTLLHRSSKIILVSGAGLSAASGSSFYFILISPNANDYVIHLLTGIPTFRGNGGMWRKYDAPSLATPAGFAENQSRVWQFFHYRREQFVPITGLISLNA